MTAVQLTFPARRLEPQSPRELMESALTWIAANPAAWSLLVEYAHQDAARLGRVRVKRYIEDLRCSPLVKSPDRGGVKLPNAYSAAFTRILAAWFPELAFAIPTAASKLDGVAVPPMRSAVDMGRVAAGEGHGNVPAATHGHDSESRS